MQSSQTTSAPDKPKRVIPLAPRHDAPPARGGLHWLLAAPHRLFFCAGMVGLACTSLWWLAIVWLRTLGVPLPVALPPTWVHGWSMANGFMPLLMFGFLFTAGPKWLHVQEQSARPLLIPAVLALIGIGLVLIGAAFSATVVATGALVCFAAWAMLLWRFARLVRMSRTPDQVHARLVLTFFCFGATSHLLYAWGVLQLSANMIHAAQMMTIWLFLAPVFVTVAHRLIPFFTGALVPMLDAWRPLWLLAVVNGIVIAHGLLPVAVVVAPSAALSAPRLGIDLLGAALLFFVAWRWGLVQSLRIRLLAMLHLSVVWLGIAFALYAWNQWASMIGATQAGIALAPLHALTMGFFGSLTFAMVTRVTAGHGGRQLLADALTWALFWLLQATVLLRVVVDAAPSIAHWLTPVVITLWCAALLPWAWRNLAIYLRPRADGRPG